MFSEASLSPRDHKTELYSKGLIYEHAQSIASKLIVQSYALEIVTKPDITGNCQCLESPNKKKKNFSGFTC